MPKRCRWLVFLFAIAVPIAASAQISPFRNSKGTPLNSDDLAALYAATNRLLDHEMLLPGNSEGWTNPKTGIGGTVTAGAAVQRKGLACRVANYLLTGPARERDRNATLTWCKTKDGWKIG